MEEIDDISHSGRLHVKQQHEFFTCVRPAQFHICKRHTRAPWCCKSRTFEHVLEPRIQLQVHVAQAFQASGVRAGPAHPLLCPAAAQCKLDRVV